ncbi:hypothetical protein SAMN05428976_11910 [Clostridium sp. USBA 49]|uniref:hypothetical protein n=1 Tax=Clostridium sp. USBA 49 TaxID=1881060 RepID=UPI000999C86C|nr:hypothetical protein [Clostridium sp. USBA 49]SKA92187.1 hypothetical protein SAMN05428976_11910 [Clostridium sp. USBA 49]
MKEEILFKLIIGPLFIGIIAILLIILSLKKRKQGNQWNKTINKVDYGRVYCQIVFFTFVAMIILCDNIYEFLLFQGSLIFAAVLISKTSMARER